MFVISDRIYLLPMFAITTFTLGYLLYYFLSGSSVIKGWLEWHFGKEKTKVYWILLQKITGFFFLGILPAIAMLFLPLTMEQVGVSLKNWTESLLWIAGLGMVIVFINLFAARKPGNLAMYPQIRITHWSPWILMASSLGWALYLLGYEFMFRGILLFSCVPVMGIWPSIALNVSVYALVHIPKGFRESIASIPMGLILCVLTLKTETIWIAYFTHVILALSNEYLSLYYHPDMALQQKHRGL